MLRFYIISSTFFLLALLSACGGPNPKQVLADAQAQFTEAGAAVGRGEWVAARSAWLAGSNLIVPHAALIADGRSLAQHRDQAAATLEAQITAVTPRLLADAEKDRDTWTAVQNLITTCGSGPLRETWGREGKAISDRLDAAATAAKQSAEAAERARRAQSYLCWVVAGSETKQHEVVEWRKSLAKQLATTFAPVEVVMVDAKPTSREGLGSIVIQFQWDHVAYSGGAGAGMGIAFDNDKVPVQLDATMLVTTWVKPGSRDGELSWHLRKEAPAQVGQFGVSHLADEHRKALLNDLNHALAALPPLADGADLIEAAKTYVPARPQAIWAYTVISHTRSDQKDNPNGLHGFTNVGKELAEVLTDHWGIVELKDVADKPTASGTAKIVIETFEETFGRKGKSLITVNGTMPTRMTVTLTISPAAGTTTNWPATVTWTASEPAPAKIDVNNLEAQVVRNKEALVKKLTAKIQAEPKLTLEPKPAP